MTGTTPGSPDPNPEPATQDEVERLRAEVARLQGSASDSTTTRRGWWRPVVAGLLVTLAALLAPLSVLATWANGQIGETDRYLETVAPLASDPDIQEAIAFRIEEVIFSYLDPDAVTEELVDALTARDLPRGGGHPARRCRSAGRRHPQLRLRADPRGRAVRRVRGRLDRGQPGGPRGPGGRTDRRGREHGRHRAGHGVREPRHLDRHRQAAALRCRLRSRGPDPRGRPRSSSWSPQTSRRSRQRWTSSTTSCSGCRSSGWA